MHDVGEILQRSIDNNPAIILIHLIIIHHQHRDKMTDRNMNDCNKHMPLDPPGTLRQNQMIHRPTSHPQHHHRIPHAAPEENGRDLYPPSRMIPPSLKPPPVSLVNYPQLCSDEFIGQGSNRLHPDTLRGQSEFVDQDSRRFHVSNIPRMMSQPSPRYQELSYPVALPSPPPFTPSQRGYQLNNEHSFAASAALKSDVRHRSLLQYSEGEEYYRGPNCSNTGQDMIHQTAAYFHHDNRRLNIRDGAHTLLRQPNPSHPPAVSHQFNRGYQLDNPYTMLAATRNLIQDRPPSLAAAPRHNSLPGLLRHPDEGEHVGTSARYNSRNPPHHNPESGHYQQGTKRLKIDEGTRSVVRHSKNQTAGPVQPLMVRESRHEESNTSNNNRPRLLCLPDDEKHLTELHCFVRKSCVFILSATSKDVGSEYNDLNDLRLLLLNWLTSCVALTYLSIYSSKKGKEKGTEAWPDRYRMSLLQQRREQTQRLHLLPNMH